VESCFSNPLLNNIKVCGTKFVKLHTIAGSTVKKGLPALLID